AELHLLGLIVVSSCPQDDQPDVPAVELDLRPLVKGLRVLHCQLMKPERGLDLGELIGLRFEQAEPHEAALAAARRRVLQRCGPLLLPPAVLVMSAVNDHWKRPQLTGP